MLLEVLPEYLYQSPDIKVILRSRDSSIVYKTLSESLENKRMYLSSMAILLVLKGEQIIQDYDGANLTVKENEMVILPKDLYVVSDFITNQNHFEAMIFFIDDQLIKRFLNTNFKAKLTNAQKTRISKARISETIARYSQALIEVYRSTPNHHSLLEIKIMEFLLLLETQDSYRTLLNSLMNPIKKRNIEEFMEENYLSNLKVVDYATLTGRSESTFKRDFKRLFGTTPKQWLITKRMARSHELLSSKNLSVTQVAMEVGYENVSYFIETYSKTYGCTPKPT